MKNPLFGFTLVNLLVALAVAALLMTIGSSHLSHWAAGQKANNRYHTLMTLIQLARIEAVNHHSQVLLCPTENQQTCTDDWQQPLMVFIDSNRDEVRNEHETIIRISHIIDRQAKGTSAASLSWRASGSKRYLRFKADGATRNQNGRLTYCLHSHKRLYAKQIIIYLTGRARRAKTNEAKAQCTSDAHSPNNQ